MNSVKLVIPLHFISWKKTPNDTVTPQRQSQFTPKMKANAVPRLLSSLVWIDQYNEYKGTTSFIEFMRRAFHQHLLSNSHTEIPGQYLLLSFSCCLSTFFCNSTELTTILLTNPYSMTYWCHLYLLSFPPFCFNLFCISVFYFYAIQPQKNIWTILLL